MRRIAYPLTFIFPLFFLFTACQTNPLKCKYKPTAIFAPTMHGVTAHRFEVKADVGMEEIGFANGTTVNVLQKVCNNTVQMFQFTMLGNFRDKDNAFWIAQAEQHLRDLSTLDPALSPFGQWADAVKGVSQTIRVGERTEVQPKIYVKIDRIVSDQVTSLLVELSQQ